MASRRKSRELALQMLFQWEVGKHSTEHVLTTFLDEKNLEPSVREFARWLFEGTAGEIATLDTAIRSHAEHRGTKTYIVAAGEQRLSTADQDVVSGVVSKPFDPAKLDLLLRNFVKS